MKPVEGGVASVGLINRMYWGIQSVLEVNATTLALGWGACHPYPQTLHRPWRGLSLDVFKQFARHIGSNWTLPAWSFLLRRIFSCPYFIPIAPKLFPVQTNRTRRVSVVHAMQWMHMLP